MKGLFKIGVAVLAALVSVNASAQRYNGGLIDKTVAVVGNEFITLSSIESEVALMRSQGKASDRTLRCEILQSMLESKLFLMQARVDSVMVNNDMVESQLSGRVDEIRYALGGDDEVEKYFGKPLYQLREEWKQQFQDQSLIQQVQMDIAQKVPEITPFEVKSFLDTADVSSLPIVPVKYKLSQICIYPDREAANMAVREKLIELRERILNGEKFSTLARIYSEDTESAKKGGELGLASKSIFWPQFSDVAMSLKPGIISQVVETPDGFHIIEVIEKKDDMFNARHILLSPKYTAEDQQKAFKTLDSLKTEISNQAVTFELAARFYSEDPATRTNGGQMADPNTGSAYFEIDQMKPQDYTAIMDLKEGEISDPVASLDNEGRNGKLVFKILRLDKILPSHTATFENDFTELASQVRLQKQEAAIEKFIDSKIGVTSIKIDPLFKDCDFSNKLWKEKIVAE